jgi:hypothetical protein
MYLAKEKIYEFVLFPLGRILQYRSTVVPTFLAADTHNSRRYSELRSKFPYYLFGWTSSGVSELSS